MNTTDVEQSEELVQEWYRQGYDAVARQDWEYASDCFTRAEQAARRLKYQALEAYKQTM